MEGFKYMKTNSVTGYNANFTGLLPKGSIRKFLQSVPFLNTDSRQDTFVKTKEAKPAQSSVQIQPKQPAESKKPVETKNEIWTLEEAVAPSPETLARIEELKETCPKTYMGYGECFKNYRKQAAKMLGAAEDNMAEAKELYKSGAKTTADGRKIEIGNNVMLEYDADGVNVVRKTILEDDLISVPTSDSMRKFKTVKDSKVTKIVEFNEDGTQDIITPFKYIKGYKKHADGSEEYKSKAGFVYSSYYGERFFNSYTEGYKKDANTGTITIESGFDEEELRAPNLGCSFAQWRYFENEESYSDGSKSIKVLYVQNPRMGLPLEICTMNYKKETDGTESYSEEMRGIQEHFVYYRSNYKAEPDGRESWDEYYKERDNSKEWQQYTPTYRQIAN